MRVAIVGTELCRVDRLGGGLEHVLLRWAAHLGADHDVVVVSMRGAAPVPGAPFDTVVLDGPADLARALAAMAPDVVSLHNRPQWHDRVPPGAAVGVTFHNFAGAWRVGARDLLRVRAQVEGGRLGCSAVSLALAGAAQALVGGAVGITPPSIDGAFLTAALGAPEPLVLAPSRLLVKKGVLDLLALARRPGFETVRFAFADLISPWTRPTAEHRMLRAAVDAVPNATRFRPVHSAHDLAHMYARSAVVACPVTEEEGLGLVALEAQACGTALVTTDLGGLREATFAPNQSIPPGDLDALGTALHDAVRRRTAAARGPSVVAEAQRLRAEIARRFSPEASGRAFQGWLEERAG